MYNTLYKELSNTSAVKGRKSKAEKARQKKQGRESRAEKSCPGTGRVNRDGYRRKEV